METKDKSRPNVFAVGPVFDDGSTRTYYISCCKSEMLTPYTMTFITAYL